MSNIAVNWVKQLVVGKSSAKHVLRELADAARDTPHVSKATGKTWPPYHAYLSITGLERITEMDRKTVMACLKYLQQKGFIDRAGTDGQTNQVPVYALMLTGTKNGTVNAEQSSPPTSAEIGMGISTKNGTSTKNGPVPIFPDTSTVFPVNQYRFSASPVPKTGHETIRNPKEPKKNPVKTVDQPDGFDRFYQAYPKKVAAKAGKKAFVTVNASASLDLILADISNRLASGAWKADKENKRFIPNPATYLNGHRWTDELISGSHSGRNAAPSRHTGFDQPNYYGNPANGIPD